MVRQREEPTAGVLNGTSGLAPEEMKRLMAALRDAEERVRPEGQFLRPLAPGYFGLGEVRLFWTG